MKRGLLYAAVVLGLAAVLHFGLTRLGHEWAGVDETVVEKYARAAGRPPREPLVNTDQGDLLLFFFLVAGTVGGFVAGYYFRELFPPKGKASAPDAPASNLEPRTPDAAKPL